MAIGDADIRICIENCNGHNRAPFLLDGLNLLLRSPMFALTFDIGHKAGVDFPDESIIIECIEKLRHLHIHDTICYREIAK